MTDGTSTIAGNYPGGIRIKCVLNEGAPTVNARTYSPAGLYSSSLTWASEIYENDIVALANDSDCTYTATGGIPVVEAPVNAETLVIGQIVSTPKTQRTPSTSAAGDSLAKRLAGKYHRTAIIELWAGITKVVDAEVMCNGTNACVPGVGTTLNFNMAASAANHGLCFDSAAANGVGVIPFHYVAAGTDGDTYTILCGITGPLYSVTGTA